jgi:DNA-binding transcriptional regulator GbsR (MarR family)
MESKTYKIKILKNLEPKLKIVAKLFNENEPIRQSDIHKGLGMSQQRLSYNLKSLISKGVVIPIDHDGVTYYMLQPFFYDTTLINGLVEALSPLAEAISYEMCQSDATEIESVIENMSYAVSILAIFIDKKVL